MTIGGNFQGGTAGNYAGAIYDGENPIGNVTIGGSLSGGAGDYSGYIVAESGLGLVKIGGGFTGGSGTESGYIGSYYGNIAGISITGDITGGTGICERGRSSPIPRFLAWSKVSGSIIGGVGSNSGSLYAEAGSGPISIGKDLKGGGGADSGFLEPEYGANGPITIGGSIIGGGGSYSGAVYVDESGIGSIVVKGNLQGGVGPNSGTIYSYLDLKSASIGGSITGGAGNDSGMVISYGDISQLVVKGNVSSGPGAFSGAIQAAQHIVSLTIGGDVVGTAGSNVEIIGQQAVDNLVIGGNLTFSQVLADHTAAHSNTSPSENFANATIGAVEDRRRL